MSIDPTAPTLQAIAVDKRGVAQLLPLSARSIERLDAAARMPAGYRIGGRRVWRVGDLRRWAEWGFPARAEYERRVREAGQAEQAGR